MAAGSFPTSGAVHTGRWFLQVQTAWLEDSGVRVRQTTRLGRHTLDEVVPFAQISTGRAEVISQPSVGWAVVAALFGAGALFNVITRDDDWVVNAAVGLLISIVFGLVWLAKRTRWVGYAPLMLIDRSGESNEFLQRVMDRRAEHLVVRLVVQDPRAAFRLIEEWKNGKIVSEGEARRLREFAESRQRGTGGR